jgi:F-type H+-transporting ATPase subunit b
MQIDWLTVVAQIVNFLILVWLLKRFLYRPVLDAMTRREERIAARLAEAAQREDEAEDRAREYREKSEALEQARNEKIEEARDAAEREGRSLLDKARHEIDEQREKWRDALRREHEDLRKTLEREVIESAVNISRRALADLADADLENGIIRTLLRRLQDLPREKRKLFAEASEPLRLSSSFDLDQETRERLREALATSAELEYRRDDGLLCGIAVIGGGHKLEWNVADYLDDIDTRVHDLLAAPTAERART